MNESHRGQASGLQDVNMIGGPLDGNRVWLAGLPSTALSMELRNSSEKTFLEDPLRSGSH